MKKQNAHTLGEMIDELVKNWKAGENVKAFISKELLPDVAALLAREGFHFGKEALNNVENPDHRRILSTMLGSTVAFSLAGAAVGGTFAGAAGASTGAAVGAVLGLAAGCIAIGLSPDPGGRGYTLSLT